MNIEGVPFLATDWETVEPKEYPGELGTSFWRTIETGNVRVRIVEYSPNYLADHWCSRGHVFLMLSGEAALEMNDGQMHLLKAGMGFQVAENEGAHRLRSEAGARAFIVD